VTASEWTWRWKLTAWFSRGEPGDGHARIPGALRESLAMDPLGQPFVFPVPLGQLATRLRNLLLLSLNQRHERLVNTSVNKEYIIS
jgi:hypothetical protein